MIPLQDWPMTHLFSYKSTSLSIDVDFFKEKLYYKQKK